MDTPAVGREGQSTTRVVATMTKGHAGLMDLYEVMRTTAAVRDFTDDPLPDRVLHVILDNARFAPSGGNRQGTRIVIVRDAVTRDRLVDITAPGARRYHAQA